MQVPAHHALAVCCLEWIGPEPYREVLYRDSIYIYLYMALDRPIKVTFKKLNKF